MPHCHEESSAAAEAPPESHGETPATPAAGVPPRGWRQFVLLALVLGGILALASVAASLRVSTPPQVSLPIGGTVFYNEACSDCAAYLADELLPALAAANVTPVVVKDYINTPAYRQELRGVNDGLGIPFELQSHLATFVRDQRLTVFEGHVPASLLQESLSLVDRPERLLIHQDSMGSVDAYGAWAFDGSPQHYPIDTSLSVYSAWYATNGGGVRESPAMLPLVLATGLVDGLNPCAFAVLLFFISFLYVSRRPRMEVARIGLLYIFAVFLAYLLIGLGLLLAITVSDDPHLIARVAGVFVIALGAFVLVQPFLRGIPNPFHTPKIAWNHIRARMMQGTQPAAAGAGFLVGLCTFPCSGGIYVAVIGLLAAQTTYWEGLGYLYLYNLAFVLPLVLILAVVSNKALARRTTTWERRHTDMIRQVSGAAMIVVGLLTVVLA